MIEGQLLEKKSLKLISGKNADWDKLAITCIAFANAQGGSVFLGIGDNEDKPPSGQIIDKDLPDMISRQMSQRAINLFIVSAIIQSSEGEYIELKVVRNRQTIASTTDGRVYIRIGDECRRVMPDELMRLIEDKSGYVWESQTVKRTPKNHFDDEKLDSFINSVKNSDRVSNFVKNKSSEEILDYYLLVNDGFLTNLGILWIGRRRDRANLLYAPTIQFIKYDSLEKKVKKIVWDDYSLNPLEMLNEVMNLPEWKESYEISDGIFRKNIPFYDESVVRELVANALVHRIYTMRGDIFINLYVDRLEIHSPGLLPLGVTPSNIISQSVARNSQLAKVFYDLKLMEKEGSGYDLIFETLLKNGKNLPKIEEEYDRVKVSVYPNIINQEIIKLVEYTNQEFQLNQKEIICLGLIARENALTALELSKTLDLNNNEKLEYWLGQLINRNIVLSKGTTRGVKYYVNPVILQSSGYKGITNLRRIEPYRLRELIREDLSIYPESSSSEINKRIGSELSLKSIKSQLRQMVENGIIIKSGKLKTTRYSIK